MPSANNEDLAFILTVDPDTQKLRSALEGMGKQLDDLGKRSMVQIEASLDAQRQQLVKMRMLQSPDIIKERLSLERQTAEAQRAAAEEEAKRIDYSAKISDKLAEQKRSLESMRKEMETMKIPFLDKAAKDIEKMKSEMDHISKMKEIQSQLNDPGKMKLEADRSVELEKMQEKLDKAKEKAGFEARRPQFFQQLFQDPGKAMSGMMGKAGGFFGDMKEEATKGGIGGLLDKVLGGGKGGPDKGGAGATNMLLGGIMGGQGGGGTMGQIGGMLGEAVGGPVGAVVGEMVGKAVQAGLEMPAKFIAGGFNLMSDSLSGLRQQMGPIAVGFDLVSAGAKGMVDMVGKVSPALAAIIGPLAEIPGAMKSILDTLVSFSAKASPSRFKLFQMAVEDVQAVIGQSFLPVLDMMRASIRLFGDVLATILPSTGEIDDALGMFRASLYELFETIRESVSEFGPMIREFFIANLKLLGIVLSVVALHVQVLVQAFSLLISPLRILGSLFGIEDGMRSSLGATARPAQFAGIEQYQQSLQTTSFAEPGAITANQVPSMVQQLVGFTQTIAEWTRTFTLEGLAQAIRNNVVQNLPGAGLAQQAANWWNNNPPAP